MPELESARYEAFARALAAGSTHVQALAAAGFPADGRNAGVLVGAKAIEARVAEIAAERSANDGAGLQATIGALIDLAVAADGLKTASGIREARLARLEALRLRDLLEQKRPAAQAERVVMTLTEAQWVEAFGGKGRD
jgi:hypothetical protein